MISLCDDSGRGQGGETMISFKGAHFVKDIILNGAICIVPWTNMVRPSTFF
jgi:hypothetical protein